MAALAALGIVFVWAYWPVLVQLIESWNREPDYSHGYLVLPLALFFLSIRQDSMPQPSRNVAVLGLLVIGLGVWIHWLGAKYYIDALSGWSIPVWVAGATWLLFGWRVAWWALPAIAFLVFMVPLPYFLENMLSQPLQSASTKISSFVLQCLYLPALSEGNTILLGDHRLEVERACSGVRIFFGITAMAYALLIVYPRSWFIRSIILLSVLPIAILANSGRIIATGLLFYWGWKDNFGSLIHDVAGWVMIPLAAAMFFVFLAYIDRLFPTTETVDAAEAVRLSSD